MPQPGGVRRPSDGAGERRSEIDDTGLDRSIKFLAPAKNVLKDSFHTDLRANEREESLKPAK
jgi:hypothetical protein